MKRNKSKLQIAQENAQLAVAETNKMIEELGNNTGILYDNLNNMQDIFDKIRNVPDNRKLEYDQLKKIRLNWSNQVEKIEEEYKKINKKASKDLTTGVGTGVAIVTMGPTAAMGVATTFGVASTGTAISSLSGAAATNAALAWLGGGTIASGGGGIVAGKFILGLAGPVGWTIAGIALLFTGFNVWKNFKNKKILDNIYTLISERDIKSYKLSIIELNERINRIKEECQKIEEGCTEIIGYGFDYEKMTERQQYSLGAYMNLMSSSTQLLVNPIIGLQPKYNKDDFNTFLSKSSFKEIKNINKDLIISLSNILYKVDLSNEEKKVLYKSFKKNKEFLNSFNMTKKEFTFDIFNIVFEALNNKYIG